MLLGGRTHARFQEGESLQRADSAIELTPGTDQPATCSIEGRCGARRYSPPRSVEEKLNRLTIDPLPSRLASSASPEVVSLEAPEKRH